MYAFIIAVANGRSQQSGYDGGRGDQSGALANVLSKRGHLAIAGAIIHTLAHCNPRTADRAYLTGYRWAHQYR